MYVISHSFFSFLCHCHFLISSGFTCRGDHFFISFWWSFCICRGIFRDLFCKSSFENTLRWLTDFQLQNYVYRKVFKASSSACQPKFFAINHETFLNLQLIISRNYCNEEVGLYHYLCMCVCGILSLLHIDIFFRVTLNNI